MRYATQNPFSYVHANLAGHVTILETVKAQNPMPARALDIILFVLLAGYGRVSSLPLPALRRASVAVYARVCAT